MVKSGNIEEFSICYEWNVYSMLSKENKSKSVENLLDWNLYSMKCWFEILIKLDVDDRMLVGIK
jgi:hypothetical protein